MEVKQWPQRYAPCPSYKDYDDDPNPNMRKDSVGAYIKYDDFVTQINNLMLYFLNATDGVKK